MKKFFKFLVIPLFFLFISLIFFKDKIKHEDTSISIEKEKLEVELALFSFENLPAWKSDDIKGEVREAFIDSCSKIANSKLEFLSNSMIKISTEKYQKICDDFINTSKNFKEFIKDNFNPYMVIAGDNEFGKFTSYYEAEINASYQKSEKYKYPIHGLPKDLVMVNLQDFDENLPNQRIVGRVVNNRLQKYYTRAEIFEIDLDAPVILWTDDYVDLFVVQIQGSAIASLDSGEKVRVSYSNNNGHKFTGIGGVLLKEKLLREGHYSMGKIKEWLKDEKNEALAFENMMRNERYIFHHITSSDGPIGAQGVPVRAGRSLAVDPKYIPLGSLLWLDTVGPDGEKIQKLVVAQDVGSAIKGVVRGDYFWGSGGDKVLDKAGRMNSSGRYFIMLPKD